MIGMALMAIVLCLSVSACSDDDDEANTDVLTGTVWVGAETNSNLSYKLKIVNETECQLFIYAPSGELIEETSLEYIYDKQTGRIETVYYDEPVSGIISGRTLTFTIQGMTIILYRQ